MDEPVSECALNKFYKRHPHHMLMFGWVNGVRKVLPTVSIVEAITKFIIHFNTDDEVHALEIAYHRMIKELRDSDRG